jgi:hypothetical protein
MSHGFWHRQSLSGRCGRRRGESADGRQHRHHRSSRRVRVRHGGSLLMARHGETGTSRIARHLLDTYRAQHASGGHGHSDFRNRPHRVKVHVPLWVWEDAQSSPTNPTFQTLFPRCLLEQPIFTLFSTACRHHAPSTKPTSSSASLACQRYGCGTGSRTQLAWLRSERHTQVSKVGAERDSSSEIVVCCMRLPRPTDACCVARRFWHGRFSTRSSGTHPCPM